MTSTTLQIGDNTYDVDGSALRQRLLDGSKGPVVGRLADDEDGGIVLDPEATAGQFVGELLNARKPVAACAADDSSGLDLVKVGAVPADILESLRAGRPAVWTKAAPVSLVEACRKDLSGIDVALQRSNHGQAASTRGDRICFLNLDTPAASAKATVGDGNGADGDGDHGEDIDNDDDDDDHDDHDESGAGLPCPANLRKGFALLEHIASQLDDCMGCSLLAPRLGMAASYADTERGYVTHLDNERDEHGAWRNARVLTAILYLNDAGWSKEDGGALRLYRPREGLEKEGEGEGDDEEKDKKRGTATEEDATDVATGEVLPVGGTIVLFPAHRIPHEVLPAKRPRFAITLWFVTGALLPPDGRVIRHRSTTTAANAAVKGDSASRASGEGGDNKGQASGSSAKRRRTEGKTEVAPAAPQVAVAAVPSVAVVDSSLASAEASDGGFSFGFFPSSQRSADGE